MSMMRWFLFLCVLAFTSASFAVTKSPSIKRACINFNDSIVTISWNPISDACGSFSGLDILGKSGPSPFVVLASTSNVNDEEISIKLPNNNNDWQFYLRIYTLCDGVSTDDSPIMNLDLKNPDVPIIDSVSIDVATQKPIIGWKDIADPDRKSFRVYTQNNGINGIIGETPDLFYVVDGQPINQSIQYTLAAIDSCDKVGLISSLVSPMVLNAQLNSCSRVTSLTWSPYVGWTTDYHRIFYRINGGTWTSTGEDVMGLSKQLGIGDFGDQVEFFVRSFNSSSGFTSSSNVVSINIPTKSTPSINRINLATLQDIPNADYVEVRTTYTSKSSDSLVLYRDNGALEYLTHTGTFPGENNIVWASDNFYDRSQSNSYVVIAYHVCDGAIDTSNIGKTVFLSMNTGTLNWNPYEEWANGVDYYEVLASDGSTWNTIGTTESTTFLAPDNDDYYCYKVFAHSNPIDGNVFVSVSNVVCLDVDTKVFIPNAINPKSTNNKFAVIGQNIDYTKSSISIYNRWGEKIISVDDLKNGYTFEPGIYPSGVYIYSGRIVDLNNTIQSVEGELWIIN